MWAHMMRDLGFFDNLLDRRTESHCLSGNSNRCQFVTKSCDHCFVDHQFGKVKLCGIIAAAAVQGFFPPNPPLHPERFLLGAGRHAPAGPQAGVLLQRFEGS